ECHSEYPIPRCAKRAGKEPMAHIQHLGSCLLDCGAQPRFLLGAAVRRAVPVHCRARGGESASAAGALQNFVSWHGACGHKPKSFVHEQRSEESLCETLRGVYPERSRRAQGDTPSVSILCSLI